MQIGSNEIEESRARLAAATKARDTAIVERNLLFSRIKDLERVLRNLSDAYYGERKNDKEWFMNMMAEAHIVLTAGHLNLPSANANWPEPSPSTSGAKHEA